MKPIYLHCAGALALTFAIAACVPQAAPPPPSSSAPVAVPAPAPTPPPAPTPAPAAQQRAPGNYLDAPQTAGTWTYVPTPFRTQAAFQSAGGALRFSMICDRNRQQLELAVPARGDGLAAMRITTESTARALQATYETDNDALLVARIAARDPLLDAMAITKGRFAVQVTGLEPLYIPAWAEVTRVIEDCR